MKANVLCVKLFLREFPKLSLGLIATEVVRALLLPLNLSYLARIIDLLKSGDSLYQAVLIYCLLNILTIGLNYLQRKLSLTLKIAVSRKLNLDLLRTCRDIPYWHFVDRQSLNLLNLASEAADDQVTDLFVYLISLSSDVIRLLGLVLLFAKTGILLPAFYLIVLGAIVYLDFRAISMMNKMFEGQSEKERRFKYFEDELVDRNSVFYLQTVGGLKLFQRKIKSLANRLFKERFNTTLKAQRFSILSQLVILAWFCLSIYHLSTQTFRGAIEVGLFVALISALTVALDISEQISVNLSSVGEASFYFKKYLEYQELATGNEVQDTSPLLRRTQLSSSRQEIMVNSDLNQLRPAQMRRPSCEAAWIEIKNLSFKYPGTESVILDNLNLSIAADEKVALVGPNGCGKSTLIKLLLGLYQPNEGSISINSKPLEAYSRTEIAHLFSTVFQDYSRFDLTVTDNIDLAKGDGSEAMVNELLERLGLAQLKDELDRPLGHLDDDSLKLSGGEWQKITVARALYKKGKFLLFDEPLSAVDPIAEAELYRDLMKLLGDRGAILVSHRLGSARQAERIIVMREGQLIEEGSHEELMARESFYAEMFNEQSKWYR